MNSKKTLLLIGVAALVVILILFGDRVFNKVGTPVPTAADPSAIDVTYSNAPPFHADFGVGNPTVNLIGLPAGVVVVTFTNTYDNSAGG